MENITTIRRKFLTSLYLFYGSSFALSFANVFHKDGMSAESISDLLFPLLGVLLAIGITYHFALEKRGTGLLLFQLIFLPLKVIFDIVSILQIGFPASMVVEWAFGFIFDVYYWINSFHLWKVNREFQNRTLN